MATDQDYIDSLKARIEASRKFIEPFTTGGMRTGTRSAGGEWVDTTQQWIDREHDTIALYERLIERAQRRS
ncbi:hypothetical protein KQ910_07860 [Reyranella sp. MMS21-HV4-11]|uniref:Uncharacterized protein n=1 Tax=Reyranella humidisoli TaxID=2849149 RepID=A0ABS6IKB7_9HYPH|nr:hypothetical protein [Reyranella sp. MMS21-HV4-11]MBU8873675.1 hypothetical protein [Reyranella sp. MMS21-HV4-11]